jgi:hypothetical protein
MENDELLNKKSALEIKLSTIISEETAKFYETTGFSIEAIDIEQIDVTSRGEMRRTYITGKVSCSIAL